MELDLGGLAGPVRDPTGGDESSAGLFEGVVVPLPAGAGVFRAGLLAEGVEHGLHRGRALWGEVAVQAAGAAQGGGQPQVPVPVPVVRAVGVGGGEAVADLFGQAGQVGQAGAVGRGGEQDPVGVVAGFGGQ